MQIFKFIIITLFTLVSAVAVAEEAFDNWFFLFFKGETELYGKYFGEDGKLIEEGSGVLVSIYDKEAQVDKSEAKLFFKVSEESVKSTTTLKPIGEGKYTGSAEDSKGQKFSVELEVLKNNKYKTLVKSEDGQEIQIKGELKDDGKVYAKEEIRIEGKPTYTSEIVYSKKEQQEVSPQE